MNYAKFFELAKAAGIEQSQIFVTKSHSMRFKLYHGEMESHTIADSQSILAVGIYQGRYTAASSQKLDKNTFQTLINNMLLSAKFNEKPAEVDLFPGSKKYRKGYVYNKALGEAPVAEKIALLHRLEDAIYAADPSVSEADGVSYGESAYESIFMNSFGLKLVSKGNSYSFGAGAVLRQGEETKTYYDIHFDNDLTTFSPEEFARRLVDLALGKFGGKSIKAKRYPTVLKREIIADLVSVFLDATSADEVRRHSSFLEGKVNTLVASKKLTIEENPYAKNLFYYYFDDEGVAAMRKTIVKNGVLQTYLHSRETAKAFGVEPTGNGRLAGSNIRIAYSNIFVKPGRKSFQELISGIKEGVYITEVAGLETGLNENSGDFSCQAEGYHIVNGEVVGPLTLITLSGNILTMLQDLKDFDNQVKLTTSGITISNALIKKMNIGGL